MVMVRRGSQEWRPLGGQPTAQPRRFERTDGSVMTNEEIAKVASTEGKTDYTRSKGAAKATYSPDAIWAAVKTHRTQVAAAKALGLTQAGIQSGLKRYMADHSIAGPLPGLLKRQPVERHPKQSVPINGAARFEPLEEAAHRDHLDDELDGYERHLAAGEEAKRDPLRDAFEKAAETARSEAADRPAIELVVHQDGEARARSYNEGYDDGYSEAMQCLIPNAGIESLIEWLTVHGPSWTQPEADRWFKALTATIDLVYPTHEVAA